MLTRVFYITAALLSATFASQTSLAAEGPPVAYHIDSGRTFDILFGGKRFATYILKDDAIPRSYFCNVQTLDGTPITRPHPPEPGADHATMHPGIWMSFGDINGEDFWRNRARTRYVAFAELPRGGPGRGTFTFINAYETLDGVEICRETCQYTVELIEDGVLLEWDSTFWSDTGAFTFGDQEEMGVGFRLAPQLSVRDGSGTIRNDRGETNEAEVWGKTARWCDYSGVIDGRRAGIVVMPHPENFRPSWMHARDYGFLAANPFGRNAMTGGEPSTVRVEKGERLRLRFGLYIYSTPVDDPPAIDAVYSTYTASVKFRE